MCVCVCVCVCLYALCVITTSPWRLPIGRSVVAISSPPPKKKNTHTVHKGLVIKPDFPSTAPAPPPDAQRLLLTALGSSLARDGDLRVFCLSGAVLDARLLARESPHHHQHNHLVGVGGGETGFPTGDGGAAVVVHPTLPFLARRGGKGMGSVVRTAFLPPLAPPLYLPFAVGRNESPDPLGLPVPLPPIRLPEGRTADHVLWVADAVGGLERGAPCLLVVDAGRGLFLYQV